MMNQIRMSKVSNTDVMITCLRRHEQETAWPWPSEDLLAASSDLQIWIENIRNLRVMELILICSIIILYHRL